MKVTVSLASHWPRVTDIVVLYLQAQDLGEGDEHLVEYGELYLIFTWLHVHCTSPTWAPGVKERARCCNKWISHAVSFVCLIIVVFAVLFVFFTRVTLILFLSYFVCVFVRILSGYVFCLLVVLVKLLVLAKWLARKTPLRKPNRGEGIISIKPRPKRSLQLCWFIVFFRCFIAWRFPEFRGGGELLDSSHESKKPYISEMVRHSAKMVTYKKRTAKDWVI